MRAIMVSIIIGYKTKGTFSCAPNSPRVGHTSGIGPRPNLVLSPQSFF